MPLTRKQRAKEIRSRQADRMSGVENLDVILGSYSRSELEKKVDFGSNRSRQNVVQNSEDFRSLLNSDCSGNIETTLETIMLVNSDVSRRIDELKRDLNSKIKESINSAIIVKILPSNQNTLGSQESGFRAHVDR